MNCTLGKKRVISGIDSTGQALYSHVRSPDDPRQEMNQESLAERVKRMVAENKGSSISVFINPNDVSRAHFRKQFESILNIQYIVYTIYYILI